MPLRWKTLSFNPIDAPQKEYLSIHSRWEAEHFGDKTNDTGLQFHLPNVHNKREAEELWRELANVMTALEAYIGRNSD